MKRLCLIIFLFALQQATAQKGWQLEVMSGIMVYKGDLTQSHFPLKSPGPGVALHLKYDFGELVALRAGIGWGKLSGYDKKNKDEGIRSRNLDFKSDILEGSLVTEIALMDPEENKGFPYVLAGVGILHFNPYTNDKNNKKTFLRPLSTEGQGLPEYPNRKEYSLTQFFVPCGFGWKQKLKKNCTLSFELAMRFLFTDYLDDVSTSYIDPGILLERRGSTAVELAFRQTNPFPAVGDRRGNSETKDVYFFGGIKLAFFLGHPKKKTEEEEEKK